MIFLDFEIAMELFHAKQLSYCVKIKKQKLVTFTLGLSNYILLVLGTMNN